MGVPTPTPPPQKKWGRLRSSVSVTGWKKAEKPNKPFLGGGDPFFQAGFFGVEYMGKINRACAIYNAVVETLGRNFIE